MLPDTFWSLTLAEALCFLKGQDDRGASGMDPTGPPDVSRVQHESGPQKIANFGGPDFTPYTQQMKHGHAAEMTPDVVADFQRMTNPPKMAQDTSAALRIIFSANSEQLEAALATLNQKLTATGKKLTQQGKTLTRNVTAPLGELCWRPSRLR